MTGIVLANRSYGPAGGGWGAHVTDEAGGGWGAHVTDEGLQLQQGLADAGWILVGAGYGDGCRHVPRLIDRHRPDAVVIADPRDWTASQPGCFRKDIEFQDVEFLQQCSHIFKVVVVKDAGSSIPFQLAFSQQVKPNRLLVYYAEQSVDNAAVWTRAYKKIRIYHTIDATVAGVIAWRPRKLGIVSGARSRKIYPVRDIAFRNAMKLGLEMMAHPGYHDKHCHTASYVRKLANYKYHVATASIYKFSLRKIIESVAVGTIPITNLPVSDNLPFIDSALVRIDESQTLLELARALQTPWVSDERRGLAELCWRHYDYRAMGKMLSDKIAEELFAVLEACRANERGEHGVLPGNTQP